MHTFLSQRYMKNSKFIPLTCFFFCVLVWAERTVLWTGHPTGTARISTNEILSGSPVIFTVTHHKNGSYTIFDTTSKMQVLVAKNGLGQDHNHYIIKDSLLTYINGATGETAYLSLKKLSDSSPEVETLTIQTESNIPQQQNATAYPAGRDHLDNTETVYPKEENHSDRTETAGSAGKRQTVKIDTSKKTKPTPELKGEEPPENEKIIDLAEALFKTGRQHYYAGRYDSAKVYFQRAVKEDAKNGDYLRWEGNAVRQSGKYDEAVAIYKQVLVLNPEDGTAWNGIGQCYYMRGKVELACEAWEKGSELGSHYSGSNIQEICNK